jgi:hypothetical protein
LHGQSQLDRCHQRGSHLFQPSVSAKCYDGVLLKLLFRLVVHALLDQLHGAGQRSRRLAGSLQAASSNCYMMCY